MPSPAPAVRLVLLLVFAAVSAVAAAPPSTSLGLSVDEKAVTVSNAVKGGAVVLFYCSRSTLPRAIAVRAEAKVLRDDDGDGVVRFEPKGGIPLRSVWIAVDETTGQVVTGARPDYPLTVQPAVDMFRKDAEGEIATMAADFPRLVVLLVRPGTGAWQLFAFNGKPEDRDGKDDGRVQLAFEDAQALDGKEKAPKHLKNGDVVAAINPGRLEVFVAAVGK